MKKLIALALVLLLGLLAACGGKDDVLKVAMSPDFAPMEFVDPSGSGQARFVGFDVSLAEYLAAGLGRKLEIVPMSLEACQDAVAEGRVDMAISGFCWMPDRAERFNLSDSYHAGENSSCQVLLTTAGHDGRYTSSVGLRGCRIGVQAASLQEWLVKQQLPGAEAVPCGGIDEGIALLKSGSLDALALAEGNADALCNADPDLIKTGFYFELTEELLDNLILLQKGDDDLTAAVNELLARAEASGCYELWYAQALEQAGVGIEISYDSEGHIATEGN